jgi:hypothetical protein
VPNDNFRALTVCHREVVEHVENDSSGGKQDMNTGLKNKLLIAATAAGLAGFGFGCSSSEEAPGAEEGSSEATTGGEEYAPEGDPAAPAEGEAAPAAGGEGSCGEGSCS